MCKALDVIQKLQERKLKHEVLLNYIIMTNNHCIYKYNNAKIKIQKLLPIFFLGGTGIWT
jgi:hypothetical protein